MRRKQYPTKEVLDSLFLCDFEKGELRWKKTNKLAGWNHTCTGGITYHSVEINGSAYYAHILIWIMYYGVSPNGTIDHEDRIGVNNRIINLRVAPSESHNKANRSKRHAGVYARGSKFVAVVGYKGQLKWLGTFKTEEAARLAQDAASVKLYGEFARCQQT